MGTDNVFFLEVLEWFDQSGKELSHRLPERGSGEFKLGAQAIVRDNQAAVFYSQGVACDALGPGRHTITTLKHSPSHETSFLAMGIHQPHKGRDIFYQP